MTTPICLITPPSPFLMDERVFTSLGILKVAASLEAAGYHVGHLDLSGIENFEDAAREHAAKSKAEVFGITATTPQLPAAVAIAQACWWGKPTGRTILGGPHVTLVNAARRREDRLGIPDGRANKAFDALKAKFDCLIAGDGEFAIREAIRDPAARFIDADDPKSALFMSNDDLNATPFPARHLIDLKSYHYEIDGVPACSLIAQLGCPFGCGFSVTGETDVYLADGPIRIRDLRSSSASFRECKHGGRVLEHVIDLPVSTPNGTGRASLMIEEGVRPVIEVAVEGGLSIKTTENHRYGVVDGDAVVWREAGALKVGDMLAIRQPARAWATEPITLAAPVLPPIPPGGFERIHHIAPQKLSEDLAWLVGYIVGDGCIPTDGRPSVHIAITAPSGMRVRDIICREFATDVSVTPSSVTDKMEHGWVHSRLFREWLVQSVGIDPADKLKIPDVVWRSPQAVLSAFVDGLFCADGFPKHRTDGYLTTSSERLAKDVVNALLVLGRGCPTIMKVERDRQAAFRVGLLANDRIPTTRSLYRSSKSGKWFWRTPKSKGRVGVRRRTLRETGLTHPLDKDGWFYAPIRSITPAGEQMVYDLTVPSEEAFIANGFVAHNCGGRQSPMLRRIRSRSTQSVVAEIVHLYKKYGYTGVMMYDDELNVNREMVPLMRAIRKAQDSLGVEFRLRGFIKAQLFTDEQAEAMYAAGFRWILVGFESGNERILTNINKKSTRDENTRCLEIAHRHGLKVKALMSLGHPGESAETVEDTRKWLLETKPDDFDVTIITTYPGTPYYDEAVPHPSIADVWTYTAKSGDTLHAFDVDFMKDQAFYKGAMGDYRSFVFTDALSSKDLVRLRDEMEMEVRTKCGIPFPHRQAAIRFEHSMGMGLPDNILRETPEKLKVGLARRCDVTGRALGRGL